MSLFAFANELCRDRDVTPDATRTDECRAAGAPSTSAAAIAAGAAAKASAENFPVALRLLPRRYRGHLAAVYGFARSVDDMGDEAAPQERATLLDELEADVGRLYRMVSRAPAMAARAARPAAARGTRARPAAPRGFPPFGRWPPPWSPAASPPSRSSTSSRRTGRTRWSPGTRRSRTWWATAGCRPTRSAGSCCMCSAAPHPSARRLSDSGLHRAAAGRALAGRGRGPARGPYLPAAGGHGAVRLHRGGPRRASAPPQVRALMAFEERAGEALLDAGAPLIGTLRGAARPRWRAMWPAAGPRWPRSPRPTTTCCAPRPGPASGAGSPLAMREGGEA